MFKRQWVYICLFCCWPCSCLFAEPLRDPTKPFSWRIQSTSKQQGFNLQAIIKRGSSLKAVINDGLFVQGDTVSDWLVADINSHKVTLSRGDEQVVLVLRNAVLKKPQ